MSPWLSTLSALDRRLKRDSLTLTDYRCLAFIHELKFISKDELIDYLNDNDETEGTLSRVDRLISNGLIEQREDASTPALQLSEHSTMIIDEIYRLCQGRLTRPLFVAK